MKYKVYLVDNILTGHHKVYLDALLSVNETVNISEVTKFTANKKDLRYIIDRKIFINKILKKISADNFNGKQILHLLYLDNIYIIPQITKLYNNTIKVIGTLHHMPQNKIKMMLLKNFSKKINCIVVHSEYIKQCLSKNGIKNVEVVEYPSFYDYSKIPSKYEIKKEYNIPNDKIVISALGGTRYDKGLDILLDSFKYIDTISKNKILLNIVGKEETFTKEFIDSKIKEFHINARVKLGYVEDDEFAKNVVLSDIIVLPYRKIFTGNSGPMTEAIVNDIPVIGPDYGNLGYLIEKYRLGNVFRPEDSRDLALVIIDALSRNLNNKISNYSKKLTVENFINNYKELYLAV